MMSMVDPQDLFQFLLQYERTSQIEQLQTIMRKDEVSKQA